MKRSELKVGDELYHATPSDWKADRTGKKVAVLAVEAYKKANRYSGGIDYVKTGDGKGNGVLVERPGGYRDVVQVGHLRGPYAAVLAEVDARQDAKRLALIETRKARQSADNVRSHAIRRAAGAGHMFTVAPGGHVETMVETLGAMLDRIEALQADVADLEDEIIGLTGREPRRLARKS